MVVTAEGYYYQYGLNSQVGGECQIMKQYSLLSQDEPVSEK